MLKILLNVSCLEVAGLTWVLITRILKIDWDYLMHMIRIVSMIAAAIIAAIVDLVAILVKI